MAASPSDPPMPPPDPITRLHADKRKEERLQAPPPPPPPASRVSSEFSAQIAHHTDGPTAAGILKDIVSNTYLNPTSSVTANTAAAAAAAESSEIRVSKPPWKKPSVTTEDERKTPQPVLGAVIWPALGESRSTKNSSQLKKTKDLTGITTASKEGRSEILACSNDDSNSISNPSQILGGKYRPPFKGSENSKPKNSIVAGADPFIKHEPKMKTFPSSVDHRVSFYRNDGMGNNARKWRNNNRDQGKGNQGWYPHGRAYENGRDMPVLLHEQRIGPRNMPRPPHPAFMNLNTGFYHPPNFPNGGIYYVPPGVPGYVRTPPYYPPIVPPAGVMHGPDPITLRSMIMKQIEYYFSIENLCKDVYLRSNMDEQGFVPVTLLASFNRVQMLCTNPNLILESLQHSSVVEIQYDRVRRRNDWEKWILKSAESNNMHEKSNIAGDVNPIGESQVDYNEITTRLENSLNRNTLSQSSHMEAEIEENNESETVSSSQRESGSTTSLTDDETSRRNDVHNHQQSPLSASSSALSEQCSTSPRLMVVDDSSCSESVFTLKSHDRESEAHLEVNNRDAQRFINVSHSQLGSVIAVP